MELKNFHLESKLFLSEVIDIRVRSIRENIRQLYSMYSWKEKYHHKPLLLDDGFDPEKEIKIIRELEQNIEDLCKKMKEELKMGDYSKL